jgi:hypothetical protein
MTPSVVMVLKFGGLGWLESEGREVHVEYRRGNLLENMHLEDRTGNREIN